MFGGRITGRLAALALLLSLGALPARAQVCSDAGAYCEGWSRDSTRREVSLSKTTICAPVIPGCPTTCPVTPTTALPSIRIGNLDHIVLAWAVGNCCSAPCLINPAEPGYSLGISYRKRVASSSQSTSNVVDCDPSDPGTTSALNASFSATYETGGTDNITISNIIYGLTGGPDDCGSVPSSLTLNATGPNLGISSQFTFTWGIGNQVESYTERRTYTNLPGPNNVVDINVTGINYSTGAFTASAPNAVVPARGGSWGALKLKYR